MNMNDKIIEKWESLGFLEGLRPSEIRSMPIIFESIVNLIVENKKRLSEPEKELMGDLFIPISTRIHRINGVNFNVVELYNKLCDSLIEVGVENLKHGPNIEDDDSKLVTPIVSFSNKFIDTYEDSITNEKTSDDETYKIKTDKISETISEILNSGKLVKEVIKGVDCYEVVLLDRETSKNNLRSWNKKKAEQFLKFSLSDLL